MIEYIRAYVDPASVSNDSDDPASRSASLLRRKG